MAQSDPAAARRRLPVGPRSRGGRPRSAVQDRHGGPLPDGANPEDPRDDVPGPGDQVTPTHTATGPRPGLGGILSDFARRRADDRAGEQKGSATASWSARIEWAESESNRRHQDFQAPSYSRNMFMNNMNSRHFTSRRLDLQGAAI